MAKAKSKSKPKSKSKKPAAKKKTAPKKKAAPAKKKAAPPKKKAAAAAAKKKAPAKKAPAKKAPKAAPEAEAEAVETFEQADLMVMDGMNVPDREERAANVAASQASPGYERAKTAVLDMFRAFYPGEETDEEILQIDPNDFDIDPGPFYEEMQARLGLAPDPKQDYFGGFGGKIEHTIAFVAKNWDGKLREGGGGGEEDGGGEEEGGGGDSGGDDDGGDDDDDEE